MILGTNQRGVLFLKIDYENNSFTLDKIDEKDGLNNNVILFLEKDINFNLWIGTNKGLNRFDLLKYYAKNKKIVTQYNNWDGFLSAECIHGSSLIDSQNNLWFGTTKGLVKFNLKNLNTTKKIKEVIISDIDVNYKPINSYPEIEADIKYNNYYHNPHLLPELNTITFNFNAIDFDNPTLIYFSYKLEGLDKEFTPYKLTNTVTYPSLPPGEYKFILKAKNRYGYEIETPIEYAFSVKPPFFRSRTFLFIIVISAFSLFLWIYKIKVIDFKKTHKQLEKLYNDRLKYEDSLKKSEEDYKRLFEHAHGAIIISDPETYEIIDVNEKACELYGYSKEEFIGQKLSIIAVDFEKAKEHIEQIVKERSVKDIEVLHKKKNGALMELTINAAITHYKGKNAVVAVHRDITTEKEVKKNLIIAKEKAEKSNKLKSEFLAQISHEIRTPLNVILNSLALIESEIKKPTEELEFAFGAIKRASDRIIKTISLILNMSEIHTGTYEPKYAKLDLNKDILIGLYHEHRLKAKEKGIDLIFDCRDEKYEIYVDEYSVTQIFANLIDNAIKYTTDGYIQISERVVDNKLIVDIIDTGIGINEEFIPHIFEPFAQEEAGYTRKFDGNGLGMALVKHYSELNNLTIEIKSKKGSGSIFSVIFTIET